MTFFENVLGLKVLRHEEFDEGCEATCNGPYGGEYGTAVFRMMTYTDVAIYCLRRPGFAKL